MVLKDAEVSLIKSKRKTISIQVKPNEVIVRAPLRMKEKENCKRVFSRYFAVQTRVKGSFWSNAMKSE